MYEKIFNQPTNQPTNAYLCAAFLFAGLAVSNIAQATVVNYAINSTVTASSSWSSTPNDATDGNINTGWNSGTFPTAWLNIDLGGSKEIIEIGAVVGQYPPGETIHKIFLDGLLSHTWNGYTDAGELLTWAPSTSIYAQNIKIETVSSPSWVAWSEISVYGNVTTVPVPSAVWLFGSGFVGFISVKSKRILHKLNG